MEFVGLPTVGKKTEEPKTRPQFVGIPQPSSQSGGGSLADWLVGIGLGASDALLGAAAWVPSKVMPMLAGGAESLYDAVMPESAYDREMAKAGVNTRPGAEAIRKGMEADEAAIQNIVAKPLSIYREKMPGSTKTREGVTGVVEKVLKPVTWLGEKADELGSKVDPRLGYFAQFATELAAFKGIHSGVKKASAFRKQVKELHEKAVKADLKEAEMTAFHKEVQQTLKDLKGKAKDEAPLRRLEAEYEALRQAEVEQGLANRAREDVPPAVNDPLRLEKAQAETARTNTEGRQHLQRVQELRALLNANAPKTAKELVSPEVSTQPLPEPLPVEPTKLTSPEIKTSQPLPDPMPVAPEPVVPPVKPTMGKSKWMPITRVDPVQLAVAELKAIAPEVYAAMKGKSELTPEEMTQVRDRLYDITNNFDPANAAHAESVIGPAEMMMVELNKLINKGKGAKDVNLEKPEGVRSGNEAREGRSGAVQETPNGESRTGEAGEVGKGVGEKVVPGTESYTPAQVKMYEALSNKGVPAPGGEFHQQQPKAPEVKTRKKTATPVERMRQRMRELAAEVDVELAAESAKKAEREKVVRAKMSREKRIQKDMEDLARETRRDREFMENEYSPENFAEDLHDVYLDEASPFSPKSKYNPFSGERGELNIDFELLAKGLLEKAKRLSYALEQGKQKLADLLPNLNVPQAMADSIVRMYEYLEPKLRQFKTYEKEREAKTHTEMFQGMKDSDWAKGPGSRVPKGKDYVLEKPGVTVQDFKNLSTDAVNAKVKSPMMGMLQTSLYAFESMGKNANNWFKENLYRSYQEAVAVAKRRKEAEALWLDEMRKLFSKKDTEMLFDYMVSRQEKGKALVQASGRTVPTFEEIQVKGLDVLMKALDDKFAGLLKEINEARTKFGKRPIKQIENYMTFARAFTMMEKLGFVENSVLASNVRLQNMFKQFESTPFPWAKVRTREIFPIKGDALDIFQSYFNHSMDHVNVSPVAAKVKRIRETFRDPNGNVWNLSKANPALDSWLGDWGNTITGMSKKYDPRFRGFYYLGNKLANNMVVATLAYSLRSALVQTGALVGSYSQTGFKNTLSGIFDSLQPENWHKAIEESTALKNRHIKGSVENLFGDLALKGRNAFRSPKEFLEAMERTGMTPLTLLDMFSAQVTWHAAKRFATQHAKELGLDGAKEIRNWANDTVVRTQGSSLPGDISPLQRSAVGKFLTTFQTFVISDFNYVLNEVLGFKGGLTKRNVGKALRYFIGVAAVNSLFEDGLGMNAPYSSPIGAIAKGVQNDDSAGEIAQEVFNELLDVVPVVSSARYGGGVQGPVLTNLNDALKLMVGKESRDPTSSQGLFNLLSTGGKLVGIPGSVQTAKSIRAADHGGNVADVITGKYLPAKRRGGSEGFLDSGGGFLD